MIQEEVTTGRPSGGFDVGSGEGYRRKTGPPGRIQSYLGQWEDYNEEERQIFERYQGGFSAALEKEQGLLEQEQSRLTGAMAHVRRRDYSYFPHPASLKDLFSSPEDLSKYKDLYPKSLQGFRNIHRATRSQVAYQALPWQPPKSGLTPVASTVSPSAGALGFVPGPQQQAVTARPTISSLRPTQESKSTTDILREKQIIGQIAEQQTRLHKTGLAARAEIGTKYGELEKERAAMYPTLQKQIDEELLRRGIEPGWFDL